VNLFEAMRDLELPARVHIAGSSEEYGLVLPEEVPIREENPLRPLSPYAVSKVAQDLLAYQYWQSYRLHTVRTRGFNHTGPRRGEVFVTSSFARQIAEIEKGLRDPVVLVGNLESVRDFTDVRDMVRAYWLALEQGGAGEVYNICSGRGYTARQVLDILLDLAHVKVRVQEDPARMRPSDVTLLVGDCSKFQNVTGWRPTIPFEVTLKDLLEHWRSRV
jgi:GDP-4-dehydro-6-deoxy-D-mannose reductase